MKKVLILAANPRGTSRLRLDEELRDIAEGLRRSQKRDEFSLEQNLAVRPRDIQRALLDHNPQIVHFSGHGAGEEGLVFEDESGNSKFVSGDALAGLFELFADRIECVVLNGCYSEVQAKAIAQHINYVVGMNQAIGDQAAIEFAVGFYDALGAGRSIEFAYNLGCAAIHLEGIEEHLTPILLKKAEVVSTIPTVEPTFIKPEPLNSMKAPKELREAIISAYPTKGSLQIIIREELEENLDVIAGGENLNEIVFKLIVWAEAKGKLKQLIEAVSNGNPDNPKLTAIKQKLQLSVSSVIQPTANSKTTSIPAFGAFEVFFSYSHQDEELRNKLVNHLSTLRRLGVISAWYDRDISAGSEWAKAIDEHLNSAQIILLLISSDFLASDYCFEIEVKRAMQRHEAGEACVIPIILRPADWTGTPFDKLKALPEDGKPITTWNNIDTAFLDVAQGIRKTVEKMKNV